VNLDAAKPGEMLCPSNPLRGPEKLNDLYGSDTTDAKDACPPQRLTQGVAGQDKWNGLQGGDGSIFGGSSPLSPKRAALIARAFIDKGYNTNYAASWYFVRSAPKFTFIPGPPVQIWGVVNSSQNQGMKGLSTTDGPISRRNLESGLIVTSNVPLLGDAAPGDINEAIALETFAYGPTLVDSSADPYRIGNSDDRRVFVQKGELLTEAFNDGPAFWNGTRVELVSNGPNLTNQLACEEADVSHVCQKVADSTVNPDIFIQDTRDWMCIHGGGKQGSCNILMADGSVKEFYDTNGDKFLNPGFPVPNNLTEADYAEIGYRNDTVELPSAQIYSGVFLKNLTKHSKFEAQ
jgi:prepilin-type processing-associated H-X9-DG protein